MSYFVNRILSSALFTVLVGATAATASAQQATFHLPVQATWGSLVLPPGDYTVHLPHPSPGTGELLLQGPTAGFIIATSGDVYGGRAEPPAHGDYLQLVKVGDTFYVAKYEEASMDTTFFFKTPKPPRPEHMAARQAVTIPVKRS
jgi:hypothetical protein